MGTWDHPCVSQGRNFFTGDSIISLNSYCHLLPPTMRLTDIQPVNGIGYSKTLLAWLELMERRRPEFVNRYGRKFYEGFRMFYISCGEAFAANNGHEFMCASRKRMPFLQRFF